MSGKSGLIICVIHITYLTSHFTLHDCTYNYVWWELISRQFWPLSTLQLITQIYLSDVIIVIIIIIIIIALIVIIIIIIIVLIVIIIAIKIRKLSFDNLHLSSTTKNRGDLFVIWSCTGVTHFVTGLFFAIRAQLRALSIEFRRL